jgi:hypothetical protein
MLYSLKKTQSQRNKYKYRAQSSDQNVVSDLTQIYIKVLGTNLKDLVLVERYLKNVDEVWSLKNNKPSYIKMSNPQFLNK